MASAGETAQVDSGEAAQSDAKPGCAPSGGEAPAAATATGSDAQRMEAGDFADCAEATAARGAQSMRRIAPQKLQRRSQEAQGARPQAQGFG